jgi:phosphoglycerate dehydrogenase-like enzyme
VKGSILISEAVERGYGEALARVAPEAPRVVLDASGDPSGVEDVEVVYFSGDLYPDFVRPLLLALRAAREVRWLHSFSAGVDNVFFQRLQERGARITTSSGAQAVPIAQTVMLYLLALSRDLPGWLADQAQRRWNPRSIGDLQGRTLGVVGLGPIGLEVARLGQAFRMSVVGFRRSPRGDEPCQTLSLSRLREQLPQIDCLVLALPLQDETRGLLDRDAIAAMKPQSLLVNIGRGELVDEAALADALAQGHLGGAGLDVFGVEPLPEASPLWGLRNVIVTPHSSGTSPGNFHRASEIFVENVGRYVRGEPLRNEVRAGRDTRA